MSYYIGDVEVGNFVKHYGIPLMRWGVRRFQNPDGTLTEAGKKRYYTDNSREFNAQAQKQAKNKRNYKSLKKKMDNDEKFSRLKTAYNERNESGKELSKMYEKYENAYSREHKDELGPRSNIEADMLMDEYPELAKQWAKTDQATKKYVKELMRLSKDGLFNDILPKVKDYKLSYLDSDLPYEQKIDGKAFVAGMLLSKRDNGYPVYSDYFETRTYTDKDGKRSDVRFIDYMFDVLEN